MVEDDEGTKMESGEDPDTPWWIPSQRASVVALVVTVALLLLAGVWEYFTTLAILACITWLVAAVGLPRTNLYDRLLDLGRGQLIILLLILPLAVRWVLLLQENPGDTMDGAGEVVMRGERLLAGDIPYKDFPVRKPPMYLFVSGVIVPAMGPST